MSKLDVKYEGVEWKSLINEIESLFLFWLDLPNKINGFLFTCFIEHLYDLNIT